MGSIRIQLGYTWPNVTISVINGTRGYGFMLCSYEILVGIEGGSAIYFVYKYLSNSDVRFMKI